MNKTGLAASDVTWPDIPQTKSKESKNIPEFNGRTLVIGSGGREHKIALQLVASESTNEVFVAPGNAGTEMNEEMQNVDISVKEIDKILDYIEQNDIGLTVVGPEDPLAAGIVDAFYDRGLDQKGLSIFGPNKAAAQLESSKGFTKRICKVKNINTAEGELFSDLETAKHYADDLASRTGYPVVLKADGLAAGKGVIIAEDQTQAYETLEDMLSGKSFGDSGKEVLIEKFLDGEEVSMMFMIDKKGTIVPLVSSQDHKRVGEGDTGLNGGGAGAYSPASHIMTPELTQEIIDTIIQPTLDDMKEEGMPFTGFLYAGLMITEDEDTQEKIPNLIEYNVRLGDPETQVVLAQFPKGRDFAKTLHAAANDNLDSIDNIEEFQQTTKFAVTTVLCAVGYPDSDYAKGYTIELPEISEEDKEKYGAEYIHAGTSLDTEGNILGTGGRVLAVTAMADSVAEAVAITNKYAELIVQGSRTEDGKDNLSYRSDIGHRAITAAEAA